MWETVHVAADADGYCNETGVRALAHAQAGLRHEATHLSVDRSGGLHHPDPDALALHLRQKEVPLVTISYFARMHALNSFHKMQVVLMAGGINDFQLPSKATLPTSDDWVTQYIHFMQKVGTCICRQHALDFCAD